MRRTRHLALVAAALLLCCNGRQSTASGAQLHDLRSLAELKATFNTDLGKPRIVLLLSPT
jgi:hypothetical protein